MMGIWEGRNGLILPWIGDVTQTSQSAIQAIGLHNKH